jgi:UDP-GlcNAc:undecaprenyl-phosphate GlcNAc-1-phosphate transferase
MLVPVLILLAAAFAVSLVVTRVMIALAGRLGLVDEPAGRKAHQKVTPLGGGVGILAGFAGPLVLTTGLALIGANWFDVDPALIGGVWEQLPLLLGFLGGCLVLGLLGLIDDRRDLGPFVKLGVQLLTTTLFVVLCDVRLLVFLPTWASVVVTVLWITTVTNAFNFLDNMDGLSAGVACVCSVAFMAAAASVAPPQWFVVATLACLVGSLLGFLCWNFPPAKVFMGDAGSLVIGFVLGVLTVRTTFLPEGAPLAGRWYALLAPVVVLALPLYDLVTVSLIRLSRGKSPFVGDTNHFSHRLVARGMTRRTAVLCLYLVAAATSIAAILLPAVTTPLAAGMIFAQTLLILGVIALLEQHPLPPRHEENQEAEGRAKRSPGSHAAEDSRSS